MHIKLNRQQSWGVHAETGFYMGPVLKHYLCYKVVMQHTNTEIITNTISFQYHIPLPTVSATSATGCLITAIKQLHVVPVATPEEKVINTLHE